MSTDTMVVEQSAGRWLVSTASGTRYFLDLDELSACRIPDADNAVDDFFSVEMRRDGEVLPLLGLADVHVGLPMVLLLDVRGDGIPTIRQTTVVTGIERVVASDPA